MTAHTKPRTQAKPVTDQAKNFSKVMEKIHRHNLPPVTGTRINKHQAANAEDRH